MNKQDQKEAIEWLGGEDKVQIMEAENGHSGSGYYVAHEEYPEAGSIYLGEELKWCDN